jgi:hypothetical protein
MLRATRQTAPSSDFSLDLQSIGLDLDVTVIAVLHGVVKVVLADRTAWTLTDLFELK